MSGSHLRSAVESGVAGQVFSVMSATAACHLCTVVVADFVAVVAEPVAAPVAVVLVVATVAVAVVTGMLAVVVVAPVGVAAVAEFLVVAGDRFH